jgi:glycosyltransferase involved in cell wall biosynthesis
MFGTTYYGALACPQKAVFIPCLHDESYAKLDIFKALFPKVRGLLFNAAPEGQLAGELYDLATVKTRVLGIGMDTGITGDAARFREKYRIREPFILYAGRKDAGKNIDLLMRYFAEYKKRRRGALKLVILGGGTLEIPVRYREDIRDLGFVTMQDKYDAYAACSIFCQPSRAESFSLVIMESWLLGRPVLVNDVCEVTKHFAQDSNGGLYFKNYLEFEGCVRYLLEHPETADAMGQNGRRYVLEHFSHDAVCREFVSFLEELG